MSILLFQIVAVVLAQTLAQPLSKYFGTRAFTWLLAIACCVTYAGGMLCMDWASRGEWFWTLFGWPLLGLSALMTAIVIAASMQQRPRAWLPVVSMVLGLLWITVVFD
jgi:hypothetical protein